MKKMIIISVIIFLFACNNSPGSTDELPAGSTDELTSEILSVSENEIKIDCEEYIQHPDPGEPSPSLGYTDHCSVNINQDTVITNGTKETLSPGMEVTVILPEEVDIHEDILSSFNLTGKEIIIH